MNECYSCEYRRSVPGDCHSSCAHPDIRNIGTAAVCGFLVSEGLVIGLPFNIQADYHGVKMGWFAWPFNFDPVWLTRCDGYKEVQHGKEGQVVQGNQATGSTDPT